MRVFQGSKRRLSLAALLLPALAIGPVGCSPQSQKATGTVLMTLGGAALPAEPTTGSALLGAGGALHMIGGLREGPQVSPASE